MKFLTAEKCRKTFSFQEINTLEYWDEVCRLLFTRFDCGSNLSPAQYLTFEANFSKHGGVKRKTPLPSIDAWFLVSGKVREGFKIKEFCTKYPFVEGQLKFIRKHLTIVENKKLY